MNWRVFKIDDPDTWPEIDCPILVSKSIDNYPMVYQWDSREHCFLNDYDTYYPNKCFYMYIGYLPYIESVFHPIKCNNEEHRCASCDDGYCLEELGICGYAKEVTEYSIGLKRVWKDIE